MWNTFLAQTDDPDVDWPQPDVDIKSWRGCQTRQGIQLLRRQDWLDLVWSKGLYRNIWRWWLLLRVLNATNWHLHFWKTHPFCCLDPFGHSLSYGQSHLHYLLVHFHSRIILEFVCVLLQKNHHKCQVIRNYERWRWYVVIWPSWFSIILLRFLICAYLETPSCCLHTSLGQSHPHY